MEQSGNNRYLVLDGIRGVAALSVMTFHFGGFPAGFTFQNAQVAVDTFFILSGFILCHSYSRKIAERRISYSDYIVRRLIRIYPMVLVSLCMGLVALIVYRHLGLTTYSARDSIVSSIYSLFLVPYFNEGDYHLYEMSGFIHGTVYPVNSVLWSLFFELFANLFLFKLVSNSKRHLLILAAIALTVLVVYSSLRMFSTYQTGFELRVGPSTDNFIGGFPRVAFSFIAGILIYKILPLLPEILKKSDSLRTLLAAMTRYPLAILLLALFIFSLKQDTHGVTMMASVLFAVILVSLGALTETKSGVIENICLFLGWLSYPLYCLHVPVANLVAFAYYQGGLKASTHIPLMVMAATVAVTLAILLAKFYDEPLRAYLTGRSKVIALGGKALLEEKSI